MTPNTGGPASEKTLLDEFAGQALVGYIAHAGVSGNFNNHATECYDLASAMLAEKARREAGRSDGKLGDVPSKSKIIRAGWDLFTWADNTMDKTDECRVFLHNWKEAVVWEFSTTDHSPDAGKMAALEALNRELVEAALHLATHAENSNESDPMRDKAIDRVRRIAKSKETA